MDILVTYTKLFSFHSIKENILKVSYRPYYFTLKVGNEGGNIITRVTCYYHNEWLNGGEPIALLPFDAIKFHREYGYKPIFLFAVLGYYNVVKFSESCREKMTSVMDDVERYYALIKNRNDLLDKLKILVEE